MCVPNPESFLIRPRYYFQKSFNSSYIVVVSTRNVSVEFLKLKWSFIAVQAIAFKPFRLVYIDGEPARSVLQKGTLFQLHLQETLNTGT